MALNPVVYTEKVIRNFLRYQLTRYPFTDENLYEQMKTLLSLEVTRSSPLVKGPYISLSKAFKQGAKVSDLVKDDIFHPHMVNLVPIRITLRSSGESYTGNTAGVYYN